MMFTTKAEYGVRLLIELGRQGSESEGSVVSLKAIADAELLPLAYLERIVAKLKKAGLVESTRGAHGGYRLARDASQIRMDEVIIALEGQLAPMTCFVDEPDGDAEPRVVCHHNHTDGHACATKLLWARVLGGVQSSLQATTLDELVRFSQRADVEPTSDAAPTAA